MEQFAIKSRQILLLEEIFLWINFWGIKLKSNLLHKGRVDDKISTTSAKQRTGSIYTMTAFGICRSVW